MTCTLVLLGAALLIRLIPIIMLRYPGLGHTRWQRVESELVRALEQCQTPSLIRRLVSERAKAEEKLQQTMDKTLMRILARMSGDAVFALPFALRIELATLAEQRETPQNLAIVILLALTSARDGNVQPVLRRLSKDARAPRLHEVAAECLREFSAPTP